MLTKSILAAAALAVAVPFTAFAAGSNEGHDMQAALLNVDPSVFTTNELAQISAEKSGRARAARTRLILDRKNGALVTPQGESAVRAEYVHFGRDDA